jgi:hypothetical protein
VTLYDFLSGAVAFGFFVCGLFFLRFWRRSADRLFAIFALAFAVFAANRLILAVLDEGNENEAYVYLFRLAAFVLILLAIVDRNRAGAGET